MSTKNLARSVTQGGRSRWWRNASRSSLRVDRYKTKHALCLAVVEESIAEELCNKPGHRDLGLTDDTFADKLHPARLWLESQVGRQWNEVRSKLYRRFGGDKTKNWHLRSHMHAWVSESPFHTLSTDFQVGDDGVLYQGHFFNRSYRINKTNWRYIDANVCIRYTPAIHML